MEGGIPLFARWTSDWPCGKETQWWYCLKDTPFDIEKIKSNYRYKIRKGERYFKKTKEISRFQVERKYE